MGDSTLWRWCMGAAWTLGPWLALLVAAVLGLFVFRWIHRRARRIEQRPIEPGLRSYWRDAGEHAFLSRATFGLVFATLMLGGLLAAGVQGLVTKHVSGDAPVVDVEPAPVVENVGVDRDGGLQLILLAGIVLALAIAGLGVKAFMVLRDRAEVMTRQLSPSRPRRPWTVRMFHDNKKAGGLFVFVGGWMFWGFAMQFVGLAALALPREWVASISMPWVMSLAIGFLMLLWLLLFAGILSPILWMEWRSLNLQLRHLGQNRPLRQAAYLWTAVASGLLGLMLNMYLVEIVGRTFWPEVFG